MSEEKRIAVLSVIVEDRAATPALNGYLSEFGEYIVGRMGIPYREKGVSVLAVVLDAPNGVINALTGKIGSLPMRRTASSTRSRARSAAFPA